MNALKPITDLLSGSGSKTKKTFRYRLVRNGRTISRHTTKALANAAQKKNRGSRVAPMKKR